MSKLDWDKDAEARKGRKAKKRSTLMEATAKTHGADFVRQLESIRDPKDRIVFVAEAEFARKGYGGARTQEIADLAAVNKAMIHYYFDNKEKLYHAVLDKILFDLIKLTQESTAEDLPHPEQLELFYSGFFDYVADHRNFSRFTAMEMGSNDRYLERLVETFFKPLFERGEAFVKEGMALGHFTEKVAPRQFLLTIYAMTMGYFSDASFIAQLMEDEDPFDAKTLKKRKEHLLDMIFSSLGCQRP